MAFTVTPWPTRINMIIKSPLELGQQINKFQQFEIKMTVCGGWSFVNLSGMSDAELQRIISAKALRVKQVRS